ncbi:MAG: pitrilysin family protein [Myxococcota bacterium]
MRDGARSPERVRHSLPNGLTLIVCPRPHLSHAYVSLLIGVGSRHETRESNGLSHMLEHMVFRGTESYADATELNAAAEDLGGFLEGATYRDHMILSTGCHPTTVSSAIGILSEIASRPRFRSIEVERSILREELLETLDARGRVVDLDNIAHQSVFGEEGLGLPIEGSSENLARFSVDDLRQHHARWLVGSNCVLSVAGDVEVDEILAQVAQGFASLPEGNRPTDQAPRPAIGKPTVRFVRDSSSQVDIRVSFRGSPVHHPEYPALVMLARLLADGLASRMHAELVDRRGLAYALHAGLTTYADDGLFDFDVSVAPNRASEAMSAILEFAESAKRFRFSRSELERARRRYRYGLAFMEDSAVDLAAWHGRAALFGTATDLDALEHRIARVDESRLRRAARLVFNRSGLVVSAVGELSRGEYRRMRDAIEAF